MAWHHTHHLGCLIAALVLVGCSTSNDGDTATGKGSIQALHAIPDIGTVSFLIEETLLSTLTYREASGITEYDDLEYTFRFDILLPDDTEATAIQSTTFKVDAETEYTFVLAGSLTDPELVVWEQFGRDWVDELATATENDTTVTVMEVSFGHIARSVGTLDVYLEAPGTSPEFATPKTTIGYADLRSAIELTEGDYQLVLTPAGDATTVVFASDPMTLVAATSNLLTVMDDGGETTAAFSVRLIGTGLGVNLFDIDLDSELSIIHGALGTGPVDVFSGGAVTNPLVQGLDYGAESSNIIVDPGTLNINVTPASNPGVFLSERAFLIAPGTYNRLYLVGFPGDMQAALFTEDHRPLSTHAKYQIFQGAARFSTLDIYIVDTDVDIALIGPSYSSLIYGTSTGARTYAPGEYNFIVTEAGTKNVIGGPYLLNMIAGENTGSMIIDSANITATDALFFGLNDP
jgi:hypothetical protein